MEHGLFLRFVRTVHEPRSRVRAVLLLSTAVALLWVARPCSAQLNVAPSSHWGASMYPTLEPGVTLGYEILGFTELGKDVRADGAPLTADECRSALAERDLPSRAPCGGADRYNHIRQTIGLNLIGFSYTHPLRRYRVQGSNLLFTSSVVVGWVGDSTTEFYQNEIIHRVARLQRIRREAVACPRGELGRFVDCFAFGYGGELDYRLHSFDQERRRLGIRETPFFVGAGFFASNIESELYTHLGLRRFDLTGPLLPRLGRFVYLSLSAMGRAGLLVRGAIFEHLANQYAAVDGALALHLLPYHWPIVVEFAFTASTGQFVVAPRTVAADGRELQSEPPPPALAERMYRLRVELGEFVFETYNDSPGGKDKGPSFGARAMYRFTPGTREARWVDSARRWFCRSLLGRRCS